MKKYFWPIFDDMPSLTIMAMEDFHDYTMVILTMILMFLTIFILKVIFSPFKNLYLVEGQSLEFFWTILPMFILIFIAYPSLFYLYFSELSFNPSLTLKIFGAQWYWIYELSDFSEMNFNSYMMNDDNLFELKSKNNLGWRLLECDTRVTLPFETEIRLLVSSQDVIHSFSIPSLSLKVDAIPGRLNWVSIFVKRPGTYYGQCSEICGVGHAFMPISLDFINKKDFIEILNKFN
uniref:Cytochrome c oxidase subunit 2 n=1 Tax=Opimothrips tubulatus TaxID=2724111 RepID=A0A9E9ESB5_9NEOP|nr:cytochrome c oxidase subunit II [Opimothrips tubulatus]WAO28720.1 cytochrome c oxidase subunit II [Opimothrips tubulatus]